MVGVVATAIQAGVYWWLAATLNHNLALIISYATSLAVNFMLTVRFTFKVDATVKKGLGFLASHAINFSLQFVVLNIAIWAGIDRQYAILPVLAVCVPVNFILVRLSMKKL